MLMGQNVNYDVSKNSPVERRELKKSARGLLLNNNEMLNSLLHARNQHLSTIMTTIVTLAFFATDLFCLFKRSHLVTNSFKGNMGLSMSS